MQILIIDDDTTTRMMLNNVIKRMGHTPLLAADGREGIAVFDRESPGLVITDWMMPGADGLAVTRHVRSHAKAGYVYVILVTVRRDRTSFIEGMEAGVDDFITKPVDLEELQARIKVGERILLKR
jgi:DNA-binding response OmpR family regulator